MWMIETSTEFLAHLKQVGESDGILSNIAYTALVLASLDRPGVSFQKYEHHLEILGLDVAAEKLTKSSATERARVLAEVLHGRHEYTGNQAFYDDLQNANLMSVIDTRKGLPVALSILYLHAARLQGWRAEGLRFPGHFLIRLYGATNEIGDQVILDPFHDGAVLTARDLRELTQKFSDEDAGLRPDYYEAVSDKEILVRLLNNIKIRCLKVSDLGQAITVLSRLVMIDPGQIQHHYEMGMLLAHVEQNDLARESLGYCMDHMDQFDQNDLMEQQIRNTLTDIEQKDKVKQQSNVLNLHRDND
ncbi:hypothetical protein CRD36_07800 [Paremcibacter congregatus]|uniref:Protein SirB1 N-terminal domain-containing protein n=2 Tax=Paremcibacter congregatus TaxID=2043170 RepID=A0A2G4YSI2_9PROT|nr:hypothetical protein CRD36_07800 [Paremcibacter congregatus]QDE27769.1 hypothetical protein FIV45_11035 [Paremcibacter congregatus]